MVGHASVAPLPCWEPVPPDSYFTLPDHLAFGTEVLDQCLSRCTVDSHLAPGCPTAHTGSAIAADSARF
jgi:hypothetical protein